MILRMFYATGSFYFAMAGSRLMFPNLTKKKALIPDHSMSHRNDLKDLTSMNES